MKGGAVLDASDAAEVDSLQTRIVQSAEQVANITSATHICSPAADADTDADADADVERLETSSLARGAGAACGGATVPLGSATRRTEY